MAKSFSESNLGPKCYTRRRELRPTPKAVQRARSKAKNIQKPDLTESGGTGETGESQASPLFKRLFALPQEIRDTIYRYLLVQPCKFNLAHLKPYKLRINNTRPGPEPACSWERTKPQCARCHPYIWKEPQVEIYKSPARSKWAKPHRNNYLCDNCHWDLNGAEYGIPCMRSLPCLCTRRDNLSILLVSKQFWNDSAPIFWTENWFAFEHPCLLTGFLTIVRPQVRSWLRRISFLPLHVHEHDEAPTNFPGRRDPLWDGWDDIKSCWSLLRQCDGLMELELDAIALARLEWVRIIRLIRVKKKVIFRYYLADDQLDDDEVDEQGAFIQWVWAQHGHRRAFESPTTALIASSMVQKVIKTKALKRHYAENNLLQRCGEYGVKFTADMMEAREWINEQR